MSLNTSPATRVRSIRSLALELQDLDGHGFMTSSLSSAERYIAQAARELGVTSSVTVIVEPVIVYLWTDADAILARAGVLIADELVNG